jgi:hypothetical protein
MQNEFKSWFKFYLTECNGTVRDFLHGQISDASKEAYGCRTRLNSANYTLVELSEWAKEMTAIAQDVMEDEFFDSQYCDYYDTLEYFEGCDLFPSVWDEIQNKLERGQLLPAT